MRLTKRQEEAITALVGKPYVLGGDGGFVGSGGGFDCYTCARRVLTILDPDGPVLPALEGGYDEEGSLSIPGLMNYYALFEQCAEKAGAIAAMSSMKWRTRAAGGVAPPDDHLAIVLPSPWRGRLIHARGGVGVVIEPIETWRERITGFYELKAGG